MPCKCHLSPIRQVSLTQYYMYVHKLQCMRTADTDLDNTSAICCRDEVEGQVVVLSKLEAFLSHLVVHCRGRGEQGWTDTHAQCHGPHIAERLFKSIDFTILLSTTTFPPPHPYNPINPTCIYYCMVYACRGK